METNEICLTDKNVDKVITIKEKEKHLTANQKQRNRSDLGTDFVAPDGGWGWIICLACGLSTLFMQAPLQQYGLLYRQRLFTLGFDAKHIISIVNTQMAAAKLTGLIHGPLYRRITFRKASIFGSLLIFFGVFATAFCTNFLEYVLYFSIVYGFGVGINLYAVTLAVNTYFRKHRRRAMGLSATITGLGPIMFPHFVTFILNYFGQKGAICIMAAITLNCFVCGCTLQPVLWHVREKDQSLKEELKEITQSTSRKTHENNLEINEASEAFLKDNSERKSNFLARFIKFFDLDLLRDLTFLNLIQGLSIMMFGELNFSVLTPFILGSFDYTNEQISLLMSLLAGVDILARFIAPFLLEKVKLSNQVLFAFGIIIISIGRFLVTLSSSYTMMLVIFLLIGFGKAFRTVFASLIIPSYVPLARLPAAAGLQSVFDAVFSFSCGPLLGMIVDASNYTVAIHVINATAAFSLLLWLAEWVFLHKFCRKGKLSVQNQINP